MALYAYARLVAEEKPEDIKDYVPSYNMSVTVLWNPKTGDKICYVVDNSK